MLILVGGSGIQTKGNDTQDQNQWWILITVKPKKNGAIGLILIIKVRGLVENSCL